VAARQIIEMSKAGFAFQASVGVEPLEHERVRPGERVEVNGRSLSAARGFTLVKRGRLREVSITPVGADAGTSVAIAAAGSRMERRKDMDVQDQLDEAAVRADERERLKNIEAVCRGPSGGWSTQQKRVDELKASAVAGEITVSALTRDAEHPAPSRAEADRHVRARPDGRARDDAGSGAVAAHGARHVG
jgi:hypothetical protein